MPYRPPTPPPQFLVPQANQSAISPPMVNNAQRRGNNQPRTLVSIPMTYTELLPHLVQNALIEPLPIKHVQPPYPRGFDSNAKCEYHAGAIGHSTEKCWGLKHKVQDLIDAGLLSFKESEPNVRSNPLPGHGTSSINAIKEECTPQVTEVEKIQTPMRFIFSKLCKYGMIKRESRKAGVCDLHPTATHSIEECGTFKEILQGMINSNLVQVSQVRTKEDVLMIQSNEKSNMTTPKPLVITFTKNTFASTPSTLKPLVVQIPAPFHYKDTKAVPWCYEAKVESDYVNAQQKEGIDTTGTNVTNIVGVGGMTRSGRVYTPEELRAGDLINKHGKKENTIINEGVTDVKRRNDEKIMGEKKKKCQMKKSQNFLSLFDKILNEAHVSNDITLDTFGGIVGNITANNHLTFTDDEVPAEGRGHNKALHISVKCANHILARVLIDNGSSLNVMPKSTLDRLPCDGTHMKPSSMIVRAFDGSRREVMGEIEIPVQIGPFTFNITFQVMDIKPAYSCLLGRPWIHSAGVVPSSLHQKLKFIVEDKLVIVSGEEDMLVSCPTPTHYIEAAEEALETSF
ncbi:uncharacterized protein LOC109799282 [Cajanus cajan]|nr:uncharacterized protein LOC109799282 [Cajanus cajan]